MWLHVSIFCWLTTLSAIELIAHATINNCWLFRAASPTSLYFNCVCSFLLPVPVAARSEALVCWDCGFESHPGHGCLSVVNVVCCQVEVSATDWSLVQRILPTVARRRVWSRNLENEAKARYRAVKIQPQWVVTAGKQTNKHIHIFYICYKRIAL